MYAYASPKNQLNSTAPLAPETCAKNVTVNGADPVALGAYMETVIGQRVVLRPVVVVVVVA